MEGAARVFAGEYARSTLSVQARDGGSPDWVVTPGGAWCRLMYCAGALTEVTEHGDMLHARIADPTGVFDLVSGGRNTPVVQEIRKIPVPTFVSVSGRAQMYVKNGNAVLSVRPDHVLAIDRAARDQWVLETAQSTVHRLQQMHLALLGRCTDERIVTPFRHYAITGDRLEELALMVEGAVRSVRQSGNNTPAQQDTRVLVMEIIRASGGPRGTAVDEIIGTAALQGVSGDAVLSAIESLILEDECYQPQKGFVKPL